MAKGKQLLELREAILTQNEAKINNIISFENNVKNFEDSLLVQLIDNFEIPVTDRPVILENLLSKKLKTDIVDEMNNNIIHHLILEAENRLNMGEDTDHIYTMIDMIVAKNPTLLEGINNTKMSPIGKAVELNNERLVEILLDRGANPNSLLWGEKDHSLLKVAAENGNINIINNLLSNKDIIIEPEGALRLLKLSHKEPSIKGKLNAKGIHNYNVEAKKLLDKAIRNNDLNLLQGLSNNDLFSNFDSRYLEQTIKNNKRLNEVIEAIRQFVDTNKHFGELLYKAIEDGNESIAKDIILKGGWPNVYCNNYATALIRAVMQGQEEIARMLLEKGADPNIQSRSGNTALHWAITAERNDLVELLLENGANPNFYNIKDVIIPRVSLGLTGAGTVKISKGLTPLLLAAGKGKTEIVKMLLEKGADLNAKDPNGYTALITAAITGKTEIVKMLLEKGVDLNAKNLNGYTALSYAVQMGQKDIVIQLLEKGADPLIKNIKGHNAIFYAHNQQEIKELISLRAKLEKKAEKHIESALKDLRNNNDMDKSFADNKLAKHIGDVNNKEILNKKVEQLNKGEVKLSFVEKVGAFITRKNREDLLIKKATKQVKNELQQSGDYQKLLSTNVDRKVKKYNDINNIVFDIMKEHIPASQGQFMFAFLDHNNSTAKVIGAIQKDILDSSKIFGEGIINSIKEKTSKVPDLASRKEFENNILKTYRKLAEEIQNNINKIPNKNKTEETQLLMDAMTKTSFSRVNDKIIKGEKLDIEQGTAAVLFKEAISSAVKAALKENFAEKTTQSQQLPQKSR